MIWLHKLPAKFQAYAKNEWEKQTIEILGDARDRAPILTNNLVEKGVDRKAIITENGIQSAVIFRAPYAAVINSGYRNGKAISLKPAGYKYPHATKAKQGEIGFLTNAGKAGEQGLMAAINKAIEKVWNES